MSLQETIGSIAHTTNATVDATGGQVVISPRQETKHVIMQNTGANPLLISFSQGEFDAGVGWTLLAGASLQLDVKTRLKSIWAVCTLAANTSTLETIALMQR